MSTTITTTRTTHTLHKLLKPILALGAIAVLAAAVLYFATNEQSAEAQWLEGQSGEVWHYRQQLTIDNSASTETLTDFPMLVTLTPSRVTYTDFQSAGQDLRFTDTNGTLLDYEIENWDSTATSTVWVRVPTITAASTGEYIYMYYGNPNAADAQNAEAIWSGNYKGVWHLDEGDSTASNFYQDGTLNSYDGTLTDADGDSTTGNGKISSTTMHFNGDADFIGAGDQADFDVGGDVDFYISAWSNIDASAGQGVVGKGVLADRGYYVMYDTSKYKFGMRDAANSVWTAALETTVGAVSTGEWHYVEAWYDASANTLNISVDNNAADTASLSGGGRATGEPFKIGYINNNGDNYMDGLVDEVRFSKTIPSAEWREANYKTQSDSLLTYGTKENSPAPVGHWKFDEGFGLTAYDESSNDLDATLSTSTIDWIQGRFGNALQFATTTSTTEKATAGGDGWALPAYGNRMKLTFDNSASTENLTDFPALVSLTTSNFSYTNSSSTGADVRFVDVGGTGTLSHEIEDWNQDGTSAVWVKVPQIDAGSTTDYIWMYWGDSNATTTGEDASGVWDSSYVGVWHLNEAVNNDADGYQDSTSNANHGTGNGSMALTAPSVAIDEGQDFIEPDAIEVAHDTSFNFTSTFSVSMWFKADADKFMLGKSPNTGWSSGWVVDFNTSNRLGFNSLNAAVSANLVRGDSLTALSNGTLYHGVITYDGSASSGDRLHFYIDGVDDTSTPENEVASGIETNSNLFTIGRLRTETGSNRYFDGWLDEVRVSNIERSADWAEASYLNQKSSSTYVTYGSAETPSAAELATHDFTLNTWVKTDSTTGNILVDKRDPSGFTGYALALNSDGTVSAKFGTASSTVGFLSATSTATVNDNSWHFVSARYDRDGTMQVYVDGLASGSATDISAFSATDTSSAATLTFGNLADAASTENPLVGALDEITIYRYARSPAQILADFNESKLFTGATTLGSFANSTTTKNWALDEWHYRKKLTINNASSTETLTDFPIPIMLDSSRISYAKTQDAGEDIRITDAGGALLDYEIESWNESGTSTIWARIPSLPAQSTDEYIWLYYGNSSAIDAQNAEGVWDSSYVGVWHLGESSAGTSAVTRNDSTLKDYNLTDNNTTASGIGRIGNGSDHELSNSEYLSIADNADLSGGDVKFMIEAWVNLESLIAAGGDYLPIVTKSNQTTSREYNLSYFDGLDRFRFFVTNDGTSASIVDGNSLGAPATATWYYIVAWHDPDANNVNLQVNNGPVDSTSHTTGVYNGTIDFRVGGISNTGRYFDGIIDEVRITRNLLRSAEYIEATYKAGTDSLLTYGAEENSLDPVLYYNFDDPVGATTTSATATSTFAYDASSFNNDGAVHGAAWTPSGKYDGALEFDGTDDYIDIGAVTPSTIKTVSFWINADDTTSREVLDIDGTDKVELNGSGQVVATSFPAATVYVDTVQTASITQDTWHHVVITDSTGVSASDVDIGRAGGVNYFDGTLDDIRFYNYVLSAEQINVAYNRGLSTRLGDGAEYASTGPVAHYAFDGGEPPIISDDGLIAYWRLDEASGSRVDSKGNNDLSTGGTVPGSTNGVIGNAVDFELSGNDYLTIADNADLSTGDIDFTISGWVNPESIAADRIIMSRCGSTSNREYLIWNDGNGNINFAIYDTNGTDVGSFAHSAVLSVETWYFWAVWHDATNNKIYIQVNDTIESTSTSGAPSDKAVSTYIGFKLCTTRYFDGDIDEVRFYKRLLTDEERHQLYLSGRAVDKGADSATDLAGNNDGQLNGPTWRRATQCKVGKCLEFDGTDDYVDLGNTGLTGVKTIAFWMNADDNTTREILDFDGTDHIQLNASGNVEPISFPGTVVQYLDGVKNASSTTVSTWHHAVITDTTGVSASNMDIGRQGTSNEFDGRIDDVRLYDYVLSQADIMQLYNRGKPVAHYTFDEGAGTTAYDESDYDNDGTLTNFPTDGSNWVTGKFGKALNLDGTNDYATTTSSDSLNIQGDLTIGAWVKAGDFATTTDSFIAHKDTGAAGYAFGFGITTASKLGLTIDGTTYESSTTYSLTDNTWNHFEVSLSGTTVTFYVNGKQLGTTVTATNAPSASTATALTIGTDDTSYFTGTLDDIRIYNYSRTAAQVLADYNNGLAAGFGE